MSKSKPKGITSNNIYYLFKSKIALQFKDETDLHITSISYNMCKLLSGIYIVMKFKNDEKYILVTEEELIKHGKIL